MKKKIGIASWRGESHRHIIHEINESFSRCIEKSGALPVILPVVEDPEIMDAMLHFVDGLMLIGGEDVFPYYYGEEMHAQVPHVDRLRDKAELYLVKKALESGKPVLAICRGMQIANVAFGGSLYQDIPSQIPGALIHSSPVEANSGDRRGFRINYHNIFTEEGSRLREIIGEKLVVNSFHHQSIKELGDNLKITARSGDGVVEAVENLEGTFFMGIQFHPEFTQHNEDFMKIYEYFVRYVEKEGTNHENL